MEWHSPVDLWWRPVGAISPWQTAESKVWCSQFLDPLVSSWFITTKVSVLRHWHQTWRCFAFVAIWWPMSGGDSTPMSFSWGVSSRNSTYWDWNQTRPLEQSCCSAIDPQGRQSKSYLLNRIRNSQPDDTMTYAPLSLTPCTTIPTSSLSHPNRLRVFSTRKNWHYPSKNASERSTNVTTLIRESFTTKVDTVELELRYHENSIAGEPLSQENQCQQLSSELEQQAWPPSFLDR